MRHRNKYKEMLFHLNKMEESFKASDSEYLHYFNSFLMSAQSVIFCLNKEFSSKTSYDNWKNSRGERLPEISKIFRELRNVTEKEGPIENTGVVIGTSLPAGITIPPGGKTLWTSYRYSYWQNRIKRRKFTNYRW